MKSAYVGFYPYADELSE